MVVVRRGAYPLTRSMRGSQPYSRSLPFPPSQPRCTPPRTAPLGAPRAWWFALSPLTMCSGPGLWRQRPVALPVRFPSRTGGEEL